MSWGELRRNACPRCRGTMSRDRDRFGGYLQCLQCGHIIDLDMTSLANGPGLIAKLEERTGAAFPKTHTEKETADAH